MVTRWPYNKQADPYRTADVNKAVAELGEVGVGGEKKLESEREDDEHCETANFLDNDWMVTTRWPDNNPWYKHSGELLEPMLHMDEDLKDSPVRLVSARFLIELQKRGSRLQRRQDLPDAAFISLESLKLSSYCCYCGRMMNHTHTLRIASVSYTWLQPDHPDPHGTHLAILVSFLRLCLDDIGGDLAIFLDFASLFQKDRHGNRSDKEAELFKRALGGMSIFYVHPFVLTIKLTKLPVGYPDGFEFIPGTSPNIASYFDRGWCFQESSVSNMLKSHVVDLGAVDLLQKHSCLWSVMSQGRSRTPPLLPSIFRQALAEKSFTSKKVDECTVANGYEQAFQEHLLRAKTLDYDRSEFGDEGMLQFSNTILHAKFHVCETLQLKNNEIGDAGMCSFSDAISKGGLPNCNVLDLSVNKIGDAGMRSFSDAISKGGLPNCNKLDLYANKIGDAGMRSFSEAISKGGLPNCNRLDLSANKIGDAGMCSFSEAISKGGLPNSNELFLCGNEIGDAGMCSFSEAISKGGLPNCETLLLYDNEIGDAGMCSFSEVIVKGGLPNCKTLLLHDNEIAKMQNQIGLNDNVHFLKRWIATQIVNSSHTQMLRRGRLPNSQVVVKNLRQPRADIQYLQ